MIDGKSLILWVLFLSLTLQSLASLYLINDTLLKLKNIERLTTSLEEDRKNFLLFTSDIKKDLITLQDHWKLVNHKLDLLANGNLIIPTDKNENEKREDGAEQ
jgi:hypothetical protein